MLIEPTETESVETLDAFADALIAIAREASEDPELVTVRAPHAPGRPARRGDRGPPAEPSLAADGRRRDALPGLTRTRACKADAPAGTRDRFRNAAGASQAHALNLCSGPPRILWINRLAREGLIACTENS